MFLRIVLVISAVITCFSGFISLILLRMDNRSKQSMFLNPDAIETNFWILTVIFSVLWLLSWYFHRREMKKEISKTLNNFSISKALDSLALYGFSAYQKYEKGYILEKLLLNAFQKHFAEVIMFELKKEYDEIFYCYRIGEKFENSSYEYTKLQDIINSALKLRVYEINKHMPSHCFIEWVRLLIDGRSDNDQGFYSTMYSLVLDTKDGGPGFPDRFCKSICDTFGSLGTPEEIRDRVYRRLRISFKREESIILPDSFECFAE